MRRRAFLRRAAYTAPLVSSFLLPGLARAGIVRGSPPDPPRLLKFAADREGKLPGE